MIVLLCRAVLRVVAFVALPVLAVVALAVAVASIAGERTSRDLADGAGLTAAWADVGTFLDRTAPAGDVAVVAGGAGAVLLGLVLIVGALAPARERELRLRDGDDGLLVRRRALRAALQSQTGRTRGVTGVRVRVRPRRRRAGGTVRVAATRTPRAERGPIVATLRERLDGLASAFGLRTKVTTAVGRSRRARTE